MHNAKYTLHCNIMKSKRIILGIILIAGILVTTIGLAAAYGISLPYLTINPIDTPEAGELLILSGTTNLPAGTELLVKVREEPGVSTDGLEKTNTGTSAMVIEQTNGPNRWSAPIDTSTLRPDKYRIEVTQMTWDHEAFKIILGETSASRSFTLTGEYLGPDPSHTEVATGDPFLRIDAVSGKHVGDQFLVTGSTNLVVGSDVIWEVVPAVAPNFPDTGTFSGMMANSEVTKERGDQNRVSFALDTLRLEPGEYTITVSNVIGDIYSPDFKPGDVSATTELILQ